jgi:hypothetical protein
VHSIDLSRLLCVMTRWRRPGNDSMSACGVAWRECVCGVWRRRRPSAATPPAPPDKTLVVPGLIRQHQPTNRQHQPTNQPTNQRTRPRAPRLPERVQHRVAGAVEAEPLRLLAPHTVQLRVATRDVVCCVRVCGGRFEASTVENGASLEGLWSWSGDPRCRILVTPKPAVRNTHTRRHTCGHTRTVAQALEPAKVHLTE